MNKNDHYNAIGEIKQILIASTKIWMLPQQMTNTKEKYQKIADKYKGIIAGLNSTHAVEIVILYMYNHSFGIGDEWKDTVNNIWYIPINKKSKNACITTPWTQDWIHIVDNKAYFFGDKIHDDVIEIFEQKLGFSAIYQKRDWHAAGNVMRGKTDVDDFLIVGPNDPDQTYPTRQELSDVYAVQPERIFMVETLGINRKTFSFYHLDIFMQVLGFNENTKEVDILMIDADGSGEGDIDDKIKELQKELNAWYLIDGCHDLKFKFHSMSTPYIKGYGIKMDMTVAFMNGLFEVGNGYSRAYLPQYGEKLMAATKAVANEFATNKMFVNNVNLLASLFANRKKWEEHPTEQRLPNPPMTIPPAEQQQWEDKVRADLKKAGITNVDFVANNFMGYWTELGSLHCLVKVLRRS